MKPHWSESKSRDELAWFLWSLAECNDTSEFFKYQNLSKDKLLKLIGNRLASLSQVELAAHHCVGITRGTMSLSRKNQAYTISERTS